MPLKVKKNKNKKKTGKNRKITNYAKICHIKLNEL